MRSDAGPFLVLKTFFSCLGVDFASLASIDRTPLTRKMAEDGEIVLAFGIETNREGLPAVSKSFFLAFRFPLEKRRIPLEAPRRSTFHSDFVAIFYFVSRLGILH